jgi:hypothetical protein
MSLSARSGSRRNQISGIDSSAGATPRAHGTPLPSAVTENGPELCNTAASKGLGALGECGVSCVPTAHQTNGIIGVSPEAE